MWSIIKSLPVIANIIDNLITFFKFLGQKYKEHKKRQTIIKVHKAIKKAKEQNNTEDLQKEIGKLL